MIGWNCAATDRTWLCFPYKPLVFCCSCLNARWIMHCYHQLV
jgi:hypothetical protein